MRMRHAAVVAGLALGLMSTAARAAYIIDIYQSATNVLAYGTGSLNTHDLESVGDGYQGGAALTPSRGLIQFGFGDYDLYSGVNGPSNFGSGSETDTSVTQGPVVGIAPDFGSELDVPSGYVSNTALKPSTAGFGVGTLASFGLDPGTYTYSWGSGVNADTLTVNVGVTPILSTVPLPASAPMFGAALMALGAVGYGVKRKKAAAA